MAELRAILNKLFKIAKQNGFVNRKMYDDFGPVEEKFDAITEKKPHAPWSIEDLETFLTWPHLGATIRDICEFTLFTGLRQGDAVNLKWSDFLPFREHSRDPAHIVSEADFEFINFYPSKQKRARTKSGERLTIPIVGRLRKRLLDLRTGSDFVFVYNAAKAPNRGVSDHEIFAAGEALVSKHGYSEKTQVTGGQLKHFIGRGNAPALRKIWIDGAPSEKWLPYTESGFGSVFHDAVRLALGYSGARNRVSLYEGGMEPHRKLLDRQRDFHGLRATVACELLYRGASRETVLQLLGDDNDGMFKVYTRFRDQQTMYSGTAERVDWVSATFDELFKKISRQP